jgi:hypothetical protein
MLPLLPSCDILLRTARRRLRNSGSGPLGACDIRHRTLRRLLHRDGRTLARTENLDS